MKKECNGEWIQTHKSIIEQRYNPQFGHIDAFSGKVDEREFITWTIMKEGESICYNCKKTADKCGYNGSS